MGYLRAAKPTSMVVLGKVLCSASKAPGPTSTILLASQAVRNVRGTCATDCSAAQIMSVCALETIWSHRNCLTMGAVFVDV